MFADVLGFPVETVHTKELGALGAAMAAAVAAGEFTDYNQAAKAMVHIRGRVEPNMEKTGIYQKKYQKYTAVRKALDGVWQLFQV